MPILNDCEIWFTKLDPKAPNSKFNKERPTWEAQIRTTSKETKKQWEALSLPVKAVVPDEGAPFYRVNLRKKSVKDDGTPAGVVEVVDGKLQPVDPRTIGNGSIGNVRIYQYEFPKKTGGTGLASVLMGIQLTKHIVYKPKPRSDGFTEAETEVVDNSDNDMSEDTDNDDKY